MSLVKDWFDIAGYVVEAAGVLTILVGSLLATWWFLTRQASTPKLEAYRGGAPMSVDQSCWVWNF